MPVQYLDSFIEHFRSREKALFVYLLMLLAVYLLVLTALHLPDTISLILWRHQLKVARSKEFALFVAFNQMESYMAEYYCTVCCSSAARRCPNCKAVSYCSEECERDHWEQCHNKECPLMADFKECSMNHLALYKDAGKSTNCEESESEFGCLILNPETTSVSKQEKLASTKTMANPQSVATKSNEERTVFNSDSMSRDRRSSKCKVVMYCSEQGRINGNNNRQKAQLADDGRKIKKKASKLKHLVPRAQTFKPFKRSSSYHPTYSSSRDSSDSDAMSSLHGLE